MKKGIIVALIIVALIIVGGIILLIGNKGGQNEGQAPGTEEQTAADEEKMVDCGYITEPSCFFDRMATCLPVSATVTGANNVKIEVIVLGKENGTCHFQRKLNDVLNLDCYFPGDGLTPDIIDQTFGNDKGLQDLVDTSCGLK